MNWTSLAATLTLAVFSSGFPLMAAENGAVRIGYVQVRDHSGRAADTRMLNARLRAQLNAAGYEAVELKFQRPGTVEEMARQAGCQFVLYTEVLDVRRPASDKVAAVLVRLVGLRSAEPRAEVEIQFRLFGMDEILPRIATSMTARARVHTRPSVTSRVLDYTVAEGAAFEMPEVLEPLEPAGYNPACSAFDAAFEKQARLVSNGVRRGHTRSDAE